MGFWWSWRKLKQRDAWYRSVGAYRWRIIPFYVDLCTSLGHARLSQSGESQSIPPWSICLIKRFGKRAARTFISRGERNKMSDVFINLLVTCDVIWRSLHVYPLFGTTLSSLARKKVVEMARLLHRKLQYVKINALWDVLFSWFCTLGTEAKKKDTKDSSNSFKGDISHKIDFLDWPLTGL